MKEVDILYPNYGFKHHKGYPTKIHLEALKSYGITKEHRLTLSQLEIYMMQIDELDFVHLHVHSEYSLVDGIIRVNELVDLSVEHGYNSIALTDLTNLFGLLEFYRSSRAKGLKPIIGSEVNVAKDSDSLVAPIVLIAKNKQGYINLTKLVSKAYVEGQIKGQPVVLFKWLEEYSEGLIALSGGMEGHIGNSILAGKIDLSETQINFFQKIFGDNFFLEVQRIGKPNEKEYNEAVIALASRKDTPIVATNNVRFLNPSDPDISPSDFEHTRPGFAFKEEIF